MKIGRACSPDGICHPPGDVTHAAPSHAGRLALDATHAASTQPPRQDSLIPSAKVVAAVTLGWVLGRVLSSQLLRRQARRNSKVLDY
jgi:hypothetical protein